MKELNVMQMEEIDGGKVVSDQALICGTLAMMALASSETLIGGIFCIGGMMLAGCLG